MFLAIGPEKLLVSTCDSILPSSPGLTSLEKLATVHPHPGRASVMIRSEPPVFLTVKTASMIWPFATTPTSLVSGRMSILGAAMALAACLVSAGLAALPVAGCCAYTAAPIAMTDRAMHAIRTS